MKYFIFRNQTIEPFFGDSNVGYSGYGDISVIPDANSYVWFYQPSITPDAKVVSQEVGNYYDKLQMVLQNISQDACMIVFTLDILFNVSVTGDDFDVQSAICDFNAKIFDLAQQDKRIRLVDFSEFTSRYFVDQLVNWKFYFTTQAVLNPKLAKEFKVWWAHKQEELALKRKKCLVLDLDNVLWGGILGEEGVAGIKIGGDYPGNAFTLWQQALLQMKNSGVILTVCSKNNEADVLEAWEKNPFMVLRKEHISAWRINWQDKATNIKELADELNIGLDSMVFVDDNPTERELIRQVLPMVEVPEFSGKPYDLMPLFKKLVDRYFRIYSITDEDKVKTEQYRANAKRKAAQAAFGNMEDYLRSLEMKLAIMPVNDFNCTRIAQMTQKTNQFNLTTHRYTENDIKQMTNEGCSIYAISVSDRFGDNGITGEIILRPKGKDRMIIDTFLLSCRILGKGIEFAFLDTILNLIADKGVKMVEACYIKTAKNGQVADFFDRSGFALTVVTDTIKNYLLELAQPREIKDYFRISFK